MKKLKPLFDRLIYFLSSTDLYHQIPEEDVMDRQRFVLFRIFSFTGTLVSAGAFAKMVLTFETVSWMTYLIICLSGIMILNFYLVQNAKNLKYAYAVLLIAACMLLHMVAYTCGGIRTAGTFYFTVIILYSFMLLGRKAGQYFTAGIILHVIYLFYISSHTQLTSFDMFQNKINLINEDFLTNAILTFLLIAAISSYLQSGRNVVIQRITRQRDELKEKNYVLEKKNNELDKFASVASHDLKAPLRAIGTLTDYIIEDNGNLTPQTSQHLSVIKGRVVRMESLINALLTYSQADRKQNTDTHVHARYLVQETLRLFQSNKMIETEISEGMPLLYTDKIKLGQVFFNLIENAIRFNDKGIVRIKISCEEQHDHWLFAIGDNGVGIDKKYQEKIFVIFQTLSRRDEVESTGAGLAIVKKIVEENKGSSWVKSESGKGSTFFFTWQKNRNASEIMQYQVNEFYA